MRLRNAAIARDGTPEHVARRPARAARLRRARGARSPPAPPPLPHAYALRRRRRAAAAAARGPSTCTYEEATEATQRTRRGRAEERETRRTRRGACHSTRQTTDGARGGRRSPLFSGRRAARRDGGATAARRGPLPPPPLPPVKKHDRRRGTEGREGRNGLGLDAVEVLVGDQARDDELALQERDVVAAARRALEPRLRGLVAARRSGRRGRRGHFLLVLVDRDRRAQLVLLGRLLGLHGRVVLGREVAPEERVERDADEERDGRRDERALRERCACVWRVTPEGEMRRGAVCRPDGERATRGRRGVRRHAPETTASRAAPSDTRRTRENHKKEQRRTRPAHARRQQATRRVIRHREHERVREVVVVLRVRGAVVASPRCQRRLGCVGGSATAPTTKFQGLTTRLAEADDEPS